MTYAIYHITYHYHIAENTNANNAWSLSLVVRKDGLRATWSWIHFWGWGVILFYCGNDNFAMSCNNLVYRLNTVWVIDFTTVRFYSRAQETWHFSLSILKSDQNMKLKSEFCVDFPLWSCSRKLSFLPWLFTLWELRSRKFLYNLLFLTLQSQKLM